MNMKNKTKKQTLQTAVNNKQYNTIKKPKTKNKNKQTNKQTPTIPNKQTQKVSLDLNKN